LYFVQGSDGGYEVAILTNLNDFFKGGMLWFFSIYLQREDLLMDEAHARWVTRQGG
jgi:hypothetical protein